MQVQALSCKEETTLECDLETLLTPSSSQSLFKLNWTEAKTVLWSDELKFQIVSGKHGRQCPADQRGEEPSDLLFGKAPSRLFIVQGKALYIYY